MLILTVCYSTLQSYAIGACSDVLTCVQVRAVKHGLVLLVDEADKAPTHVTCVLKNLIKWGEMSLSDGRKIVPSELIHLQCSHLICCFSDCCTNAYASKVQITLARPCRPARRGENNTAVAIPLHVHVTQHHKANCSVHSDKEYPLVCHHHILQSHKMSVTQHSPTVLGYFLDVCTRYVCMCTA